MSRVGDWKCQCGYNNFASKTTCKCGKPKPGFTGSLYNTITSTASNMLGSFSFAGNPHSGSIKSGDWICECGDHNFASRQACRKCGKNKPRNEVVQSVTQGTQAVVKKLGDWDCDDCKELNFAKRFACFKCGKAREGYVKKEDDACLICMDREIDACLPCGHLLCCNLCAQNLDKCPLCRRAYNPDTQIIKTYKAK
jgi:hypothetical protein